jgi:hypothetical protein
MCNPRNVFGDDAFVLVNKLVDANAWLKTWNGKNIRCPFVFKISTQQQNKWKVGHVLVTQMLLPINIPIFGYGWIYHIISSLIENHKQYQVMVGKFPTCICINFVSMMIGSLGGCGKWVHWKHLYYILQNVMLCGLMEMFIHHLASNWDKVHKLTCRTQATKVN